MAGLSATFAADFSAFNAACAQAEVSLKGIESGASSVERTLTRMADSLSGTKIIQQAAVMAEAVERVGGVSTLTAKELQRVGGTAQEAADKLRALGQDIPPGIQKIADAARAAQPQVEGLFSSVKNVAAALGVAFTAGAVITGIKQLIGGALEMADAINDTTQKLGVSAEHLQGWWGAAEQAGATAEDVTRAISTMNLKLAGGSDSTVKALRDAGLEFHAIRDMKADESFAAITTAIMNIKDPLIQARIAAELFGEKVGPALLGAIRDDMVKVGDGVTKMSDDTVKQLAAAQQAWETFGRNVTIISGGVLAATANMVTETTSSWSKASQFLADFLKGGTAFAIGMQDVRRGIEKANAAVLIYGPTLEQLTRTTHKTTEEIKAEEDAHRKAVDAVRAHQAAIAGMADVLTGQKVADHVRDLAEAVELAEKHGGLAAIEEAKLADELMRLQSEGVKLEPVLQRIVDKYSILEQQTIDAKVALEDWSREVKAHADAEKQASEDIQQYFKDQAEAADAAAKAETDDWQETVRQHTQAEKAANAEVQKYLDETKKRQDEMVAYMSDALVGLFDASLRGWDAFKAELNRLWKEILHDFEEELIKKMVAKWLAALAEMAAAAASGTFLGDLLSFLGFGGPGKGGKGGDTGTTPLPSQPMPPPQYGPDQPPEFQIPPPPQAPPDLPPGDEWGPGGPTIPGPGPKPPPHTTALGGRVTATGIEYLQAGGVVWPWDPVGSDTVPAMLTPGERVLSVSDAKRYDAGLGSGRARRGLGGTVIIELNGRLLAQVVVPELESEVRRLGFGR